MPRLENPRDYPKTMLRYAHEAVAMTQNRERQDLDTDRLFELAPAHLVQNVGTAAETTNRNKPTWNGRLTRARSELYRFRNRPAHDFDPINRDALWHTATQTIPEIIPELQTIVAGL